MSDDLRSVQDFVALVVATRFNLLLLFTMLWGPAWQKDLQMAMFSPFVQSAVMFISGEKCVGVHNSNDWTLSYSEKSKKQYTLYVLEYWLHKCIYGCLIVTHVDAYKTEV